MDIHAGLNLPVLKTAALVVAWTEEQLAQLDEIVSKAHKNGVDDARQISRRDLLSREVGLSTTALGAVEVPANMSSTR